MSTNISDHSIAVTDSGDVQFTCNAAEAGACRLGCVAECEDYHRADCDRSAKDTGICGALPYLEVDDPFDTYIGATDRQDWQSGPIDTEWDSYYETWVWRFPGDDRELPGSARYREAG